MIIPQSFEYKIPFLLFFNHLDTNDVLWKVPDSTDFDSEKASSESLLLLISNKF
jgi:hypothetical protein